MVSPDCFLPVASAQGSRPWHHHSRALRPRTASLSVAHPFKSPADTDSRAPAGGLGAHLAQTALSLSDGKCCSGCSCSPVVSIRSGRVCVKDYVFATEGRIWCLPAGVRAGRADYSAALCQPVIGPVLYHLCRSAVCWPRGRVAPSRFYFLCPFRVEDLYLLWECNLFLMDNVTPSGAGSWVS